MCSFHAVLECTKLRLWMLRMHRMDQKLARLLFSSVFCPQWDLSKSNRHFLKHRLINLLDSLPVETCSSNAGLECGKLPPWMHQQLIKLLFSVRKQVFRLEKTRKHMKNHPRKVSWIYLGPFPARMYSFYAGLECSKLPLWMLWMHQKLARLLFSLHKKFNKSNTEFFEDGLINLPRSIFGWNVFIFSRVMIQ